MADNDKFSVYKTGLLGIVLPTKQALYANMLSIESEVDRLKDANKAADKIDLINKIEEKVDLLKKILNEKGHYKKKVFFRETAHRIDEDLVLLKDKAELLTDAYSIRDNLKLTDLPKDIINAWTDKVKKIIDEKLDKKDLQLADTDLEEIRKILRAGLNLINRSIDNSFLELYVLKFNNMSQMLIVFFLLLSIAVVRAVVCCGSGCIVNYFYIGALGALGGCLSAIISTADQSTVKGNFLITFIINVFGRPIIGAATALVVVLAIKSHFVFNIQTLEHPETAYRILGFAGGFGGEKLVKATMDSIMHKLSLDAGKNQGQREEEK